MFFQKMMHKKGYGRVLVSLLVLMTFLVGIGLTGCGGAGDSGASQQPAQQQQQSQQPQQNQQAQQPQQEQQSQDKTQATQQNSAPAQQAAPAEQKSTIKKDGTYTSKQDVADYLHEYGKLPGNFITKKEAQKLGWDSEKGNLAKVAPGKSIGGDSFGNREGLLPKKDGRKYYECDINYEGGYRGAERIIYSNDGLIYFTDDHYKSFTQLY